MDSVKLNRRQMLNRRQVLGAGAAALAVPLAGRLVAPALAQTAGSSNTWGSLAALSQEAQRLGLAVPRMSLSASAGGGGYDETMPAIVDFMDSVQASATETRDVSSAEVDSLLARASDILRAAREAEVAPREDPAAQHGAAAVTAPKFEDIADEYRKLFETCVISDARRSDVQWYVSKITDPARRKDYEGVFTETCVPWYFIAVIHGMEASFDFKSHIHNGDSLKAKTTHVPAGRPVPWNPPNDWTSSAVDAMRYDKLDEKGDWDLAHMLYRWEAYNGWRSRVQNHINTPYLWSFSNHYTKGKFVADGVWDGSAVSKQCGAAVMLKALVEQGAVAPPA